MIPNDPFGLDDLIIAIGVLVFCCCAGFMCLEIGGWFSRRHDKDK
jgi:hypothetical protein